MSWAASDAALATVAHSGVRARSPGRAGRGRAGQWNLVRYVLLAPASPGRAGTRRRVLATQVAVGGPFPGPMQVHVPQQRRCC